MLPTISKEEAVEILRLDSVVSLESKDTDSAVYSYWDKDFPTTAGPFQNDEIAGQAFTTFRMESWKVGEATLMFCQGEILKILYEGDSDPQPPLFSEEQIAYVCRETLRALDYLHSFGFPHGELKSDEILVSSDGRLKLTTPSNKGMWVGCFVCLAFFLL